ncbi:MAG: riboflavin synthase [Lachnospiraceae bacterium]|nr:riboflavin synthase [Lachnospiraceae bacterium]
MFTGIIEEIGEIKRITKNNLNTDILINASTVLDGTGIGDSIAVNGVCLTVTKLFGDSFQAFAMAETMRRTAFNELKVGSHVNLERAMAADGRFGGHIVSGHIDGVGKIKDITAEGKATWVQISAGASIMKYIVEKGSIAIDGISLTVAKVDNDSFSVSLIPHTGSETTLLSKKVGSLVNLENDIIAKYIERLVTFKQDENVSKAAIVPAGSKNKGGLSMETLMNNGFM